MTDLVAITSGVLTVMITASLTYLTTVAKIRKDLEATYDRDLRDHRIRVYQCLWKSLMPLAKYANPQSFSVAEAKGLAQELRNWYFQTGGLFLSERARDCYFKVQDALKEMCEKESLGDDDLVTGPRFETIRKRGSRLRTQMTVDVGTRKRPLTEESEES